MEGDCQGGRNRGGITPNLSKARVLSPKGAKLGVAVSNSAAPPMSHLRFFGLSFIKPPAVGGYMHCGQVGSNLSKETLLIWLIRSTARTDSIQVQAIAFRLAGNAAMVIASNAAMRMASL